MNPEMSYSEAGLALTKEFEGLSLSAYQDVAGIWTIGYGHTGPEVHEGLTWTPDQATAALQQDVKVAVDGVNSLVVVMLHQCQFDALVDFTYNVGMGAFSNSTLLRMVNKDQMDRAAGQFGRWVYAGGQVQPGLVRRRQAEREMFEGEPLDTVAA